MAVRLRLVVAASDRAYASWEEIYEDNVGRVYGLMYVKDGNRPDAEDLTAEVFTAALPRLCSYHGCHLRLNDAERRLDCPCHRTGFGFDGTVITSQLPKHPPRLPAIQVREQDGQIRVYA